MLEIGRIRASYRWGRHRVAEMSTGGGGLKNLWSAAAPARAAGGEAVAGPVAARIGGGSGAGGVDGGGAAAAVMNPSGQACGVRCGDLFFDFRWSNVYLRWSGILP
jgi:hypothetical protein